MERRRGSLAAFPPHFRRFLLFNDFSSPFHPLLLFADFSFSLSSPSSPPFPPRELYTHIVEKEEALEEFVELRENLVLFFVYFVRFENMFCYVVGVIKSMVSVCVCVWVALRV